MRIVALAGAVGILLIVLHAVAPSIQGLPLGGSEIAQLGIVFGLAFAAAEVTRLIRGYNAK